MFYRTIIYYQKRRRQHGKNIEINSDFSIYRSIDMQYCSAFCRISKIKHGVGLNVAVFLFGNYHEHKKTARES